ncbi:hypothetical protein D7X12_33385 [Corallococcus sicarius]|uniref:Uncharacterized protein n=1 Tax=Corallococcus sicarius TaxID=2316726 RepID=A0A3A8MWZ8_9BACT|nr:hypothetical protein D7X12_33385 [Corallococcus sicarius]
MEAGDMAAGVGACKDSRVEAYGLHPAERHYSATVASRTMTVMPPPQVHLSEAAETRTIWALVYMVCFSWIGVWG